MQGWSVRRVVLAVAAGVVAFAIVRAIAPPDERAGERAPQPAAGSATGAASPAPEAVAPDAPLAPPSAVAPAPAPAESDPLAAADFDAAFRWSAVDLEAVQRALPENLYWSLSAPTDDPDELRRRDEERARWNREYGKVLSGTATDAELRDYFTLRRRVSEDAIAFSSHLLDQYGDALPERDVGLLELALRLHAARLEELPRREAEATLRKHEQDRLREAWLADEAAFATDDEHSASD